MNIVEVKDCPGRLDRVGAKATTVARIFGRKIEGTQETTRADKPHTYALKFSGAGGLVRRWSDEADLLEAIGVPTERGPAPSRSSASSGRPKAPSTMNFVVLAAPAPSEAEEHLVRAPSLGGSDGAQIESEGGPPPEPATAKVG